MLLETLSISQRVLCQDWNARVELAQVVLQGGRRKRTAGGNQFSLPDALSTKKVYEGFGRPAVGIQERHWGTHVGEKGEIWDTREESQCRPTNNLHPRLPVHPSLCPGSHISICGSNDPASGPHGQSRTVIKMNEAADPMVPFRRVEHWPRDLYLIDQPVQREKSSFPPERHVPHSIALFQSKCLCEKERIAFLPPLLCCASIIPSSGERTRRTHSFDFGGWLKPSTGLN